MGVLFLDPLLLLAVVAALVVTTALVTRRPGAGWFGHDAWWTRWCWPAPLVVATIPVLAGLGLGLGRALTPLIGEGPLLTTAIYTLVLAAPCAWLLGWPPRWVFPRWARERIVEPPGWTRTGVPPEASTAIQATHGHASRAAWTWRIDGVAGFVWLDGDVLRFRSLHAALPGETDDDDRPAATAPATPLRGLDAPVGGRWRRDLLDIELGELDAVTSRARRIRHRDGVLRFEVEGRRPVHLWVPDVDALEAAIIERRGC